MNLYLECIYVFDFAIFLLFTYRIIFKLIQRKSLLSNLRGTWLIYLPIYFLEALIKKLRTPTSHFLLLSNGPFDTEKALFIDSATQLF